MLRLFVPVMLLSLAAVAGEQLFNLADTPTGPRFELSKERTWPVNPGDAEVCLWDGDRFAAMSITIDDNTQPDHEWWMHITSELGMKVTWFVVTKNVTGGFGGTWEGFTALNQAGHAIQSHTATHLGKADQPDWQGIEWEYAESQKDIEGAMPGNRVLTMAYSGGKNSELHDREVAAKYYIAVRGTRGTPNKANQIDYLNTSSSSGRIGREYIDPILEGHSSISWMNSDSYLRGWLSTHFHQVKPDKREEVAEQLRYIKSREADLWVGLFDEVVRYGMERDTHTLEVTKNSKSAIEFELSDRMDDTVYTVPLTVKVRLSNDWKNVSAEQGGKKVGCQTIEHDDALYALVQAVPDQGAVVLTPSS
jgi:hypothetical protein